ncbi:MAG TPA: hypothetical protein G4N94_11495 [Caldilineae bacterium]|nr:hypothetical protein [Caldilineae bacterium]
MNKNSFPRSKFWWRSLVLALLMIFVATTISQAQTGSYPRTMNFQGRLLDSSGNPLDGANRCMRFRMCSDGSSESACTTSQKWPASVYEYHTITTESGSYKAGLFSVVLGETQALPPDIFQKYDSLYLEIGVGDYNAICNDAGVTYTTLEPRSLLRASAYAMRSRRVNTVEIDDGYLIEIQNNGSGGALSAKVSGTTNDAKAGYFYATGSSGATYGVYAQNDSDDDDAAAGYFWASNNASGSADAVVANSYGGYGVFARGARADVYLANGELSGGEYAAGLRIRSYGGVDIHLDEDGGESTLFRVLNDADTVVFSIDESGAMTGGTHDHWGESWSGNGTGLTLTGSDGQGRGVRGVGHAPSGVSPSISLGLWGDTDSGIGVLGYTSSTTTDMAGVAGSATASSGRTYGVWGQTSSSTEDAAGGYFKVVATTGKTFGVRGENNSSTDWASGGKFVASATSGKTFGVYAENSSTTDEAAAAHFRALGGSGKTIGVYAENNSSSEDAEAGRFISTPTSGKTRTIYVSNNSTTDGSGAGWFSADSGSGAVYGVFARTNSTTDDARAGWFYAQGTSGKTQAIQATNFSESNDAAAGSFSEEGSAGTTYGVYATAASTSGIGVYGYGRGGTGGKFASYSGNLIEGWEEESLGGGPTALRFKVDYGGNVYADGSYNCGLSSGCFNTGIGADVAERIDAQETLAPGDVVEIDLQHPGLFRKAQTPFSVAVAGVISTNPGVTMGNNFDAGGDQWRDSRPLLALVGVVPVKVSAENGPIQPGDLLVASSTPGHAMRAGENPPQGTVIGKALASLQQGVGVIQMLAALQ